jgi:hypothetical protein
VYTKAVEMGQFRITSRKVDKLSALFYKIVNIFAHFSQLLSHAWVLETISVMRPAHVIALCVAEA